MRSLWNWWLVLTCLLVLLISVAGCGGGNANVVPADPYIERGNYEIYGLKYLPYGYARDWAPIDRNVSVMTDEYRALYEDWDVFPGDLMVSLEPGVNEVNADRFTFASGNVKLDPRKAFHKAEMLSGDGGLSLMVYCIDALYDLEYISAIEIQGTGFFKMHSDRGLYVGIRKPGRSIYAWYGPFAGQSEWRVELPQPRSFVQQRGNYFIALAVADGDEAEISRLLIDVEY